MMKKFSDQLSIIITTLWVGGLWITSAWAYVLFKTLNDRVLAGQIAGQFFTIMAYIGMVAAIYLLLARLFKYGSQAFKQTYFWVLVLMFLLVLAGQYGIQPVLAQLKNAALPADVMQSVFADRFKTWHGIASMAYVFECVLGLVIVTKR
jgi:hypothetical protein